MRRRTCVSTEMRLLVKAVLMLMLMRWDVLIMKGQVTVKVLLEVKVEVKVFVEEEVFLCSLSSTPPTMPHTRPGGA